MIAAFSPFLALRYLLTRRINLLAMFGVTFAVWAMIVVNSVFTGFVSEIRTDVRRASPEMMLTDLPLDTGYEPLRAALEADTAVAATAPRLRHHGLLQPLRVPKGLQPRTEAAELNFDHMESGFALLLGIDPAREEAVTPLRQWVARSEEVFALHHVMLPPSTVLLDPDPDRRAQLLLPDATEWLARRRAGLAVDTPKSEYRSAWPGVLLGWRRAPYTPWLREGDPIDLLTAASVPTTDGTPQLRSHRVRVAFAGYFATGYRAFDETTALLPIETLRTMFGQDIHDPDSIDLVTDVAIRLQPGLSAHAITAARDRLQRAAQAVLPAGSAPCSVLDWQQQNTVFLSAVATEQAMMQFVLFVVMLVAAFVIYAVLHMMVVQKWKDIGILSALGGTPRAVGAVFLLCGVVVAVLGTALGTGLGTLSALSLNDANEWLFATTGLELFPRRLFDLQQVPVRLDPAWLVQVATGAIVFAVLVALFPARKAARMNPVQAFAHE
ncbi:MAG: ABC transporter permease [Planctomycetes bacterium]|nr:ABC transporter permease [Planctomycetota bacterium]